MTSRRPRAILACVALPALIAACSSTRIIEIDSDPQGANVYLNGEQKGQTPIRIQLDFSKHPRLFVQCAYPGRRGGYQEFQEDTVPENNEHLFRLAFEN